ncbi:hypothetical protein KO493_10695 [Tamlana agarivorans]|uniref:Uncharacterized protein n=1 Tax=Pseudotamlana agarivorans TaxID=481183 RepID=A0ACC5UA05_9FLAO|nr:hypothetical protein [Tamlana agarivorans]MBU2951164.1 hypothetical protein [Tamlana agarivorans]
MKKIKELFLKCKTGVFYNEQDILLLVLRMILIILLVLMNDNAVLSILIPVIVVPGLLFKNVVLNKYFWLILTIFGTVPYLIFDLHGYVPNHKHIFAYVILAVFLMLFFSEKENSLNNLRFQAKYIIGLCFLFAVIGKFLAPEFLNGSFFEFTNTIDPRFYGLTSVMGEIDMQLLKENATNMESLLNTSNVNYSFDLIGADKIEDVGLITSYWTIFIEGMIAISFCLPSKFLLSKYRNIFLIAFILTTYPIATVYGFAIVLATMGFIQSTKRSLLTGYSLFYLLVFIGLPLIKIPFLRVFNIIF